MILSGLLDDGTAGLMVVHAAGGKAIVQEPRTALFTSMPTSALRQVPEALAVPVSEIADLLLKLSREALSETAPRRSTVVAEQKEVKLAEADMPEIENNGRRGKPSQFACPDCGGVLWEIDDAVFCASVAGWACFYRGPSGRRATSRSRGSAVGRPACARGTGVALSQYGGARAKLTTGGVTGGV